MPIIPRAVADAVALLEPSPVRSRRRVARRPILAHCGGGRAAWPDAAGVRPLSRHRLCRYRFAAADRRQSSHQPGRRCGALPQAADGGHPIRRRRNRLSTIRLGDVRGRLRHLGPECGRVPPHQPGVAPGVGGDGVAAAHAARLALVVVADRRSRLCPAPARGRQRPRSSPAATALPRSRPSPPRGCS